LRRGYEGFITIDGNNKDSIEDVPRFIEKLEGGYDYVQGSRFIPGGRAVNTPFLRYAALRLIHAPIISLSSGRRCTDTTNAFRAYSRRYLEHPRVKPFRDIFAGYELLAYLSVRSDQIGLMTCEVPVARIYPEGKQIPTKISAVRGNWDLFRILVENAMGKYKPEEDGQGFNIICLLNKFLIIRLVFYGILLSLLVLTYNNGDKSFDLFSESLAVTNIIVSRDNLKINRKYGLLAISPKGNTFDGGVLTYQLYDNGTKDTEYDIGEYKSNVGLQGWIYYIFVKAVKGILKKSYVGILRLLCCVFLAMVFVLICREIKRKYNLLLAACFYITFLFSPWIINFAHNLYWVEFLWFIPMLLGLFSLNYTEKQRIVYPLLFFSILIKCLCGYEYITVIMMSSIMFLAVEYFTVTDREKKKALIVTVFWFSIISIAAFLSAITIHALLRGNGSLTKGYVSIFREIALRRILGVGDETHGVSQNASVLDVIITYIKPIKPVIPELSIFNGFLFPYMLFAPIVVFVIQGKELIRTRSFEMPLYIISFLTCISWYVFGKGHSFVHVPMNYVLWYFGIVQVCLYVILRFFGLHIERISYER
jgi:hypothetical protein